MASAQSREEKPLPPRGVVIDIDSPERDLYKIAVPELPGPSGEEAAEVLRNDFRLVSLFKVLDPRSFIADLETEKLAIKPSAWTSVGAQGVVKAQVQRSGSRIEVHAKLFELAQGAEPTLSKTYRGQPAQLRAFMHDFANRVLDKLTGEAGAFGSRITFARRRGRGRKDVMVAEFDGHRVGRVSSGRGVSMLPAFGPKGIWYSKLTQRGMYITHTRAKGRPVISGGGMNMGPTICNGRVFFSSTRSGNSDIYSASLSGSNVRRLTRHPGIDVSPACGPDGRIAFVSDRQGGPQIFVMNGDGSGAKRVTFRGEHNQTPAWCPDPKKSLLAFTGRSGNMDIFTVDLKTQKYTRLTQGQGDNKDPAFSPDCRMVAFASSRGGIFISSPEGLNQTLVMRGPAETLEWSR